MKIVILGDIHYPSRTDSLEFLDVVKEEKPDLIIATGDYTEEEIIKELKSIAKFLGIKGNCDYVELPSEICTEILNKKVLIIHSHEFGRGNINGLVEYGKKLGVEVIVFGHTHKPYLGYIDGILLLNPGSISGAYPGDHSKVPKSYIVIEDWKIMFKNLLQ